MALEERGEHIYGASQSDLREAIADYGAKNYPPTCFADARCACGGGEFHLELDDTEGAALRTRAACRAEHPIGDSEEYLAEASLEVCSCLCGAEVFEITVGVALYADSEDVRWLYLGCRCPKCGLLGVYGDWKNEYNGYRELLAKV